MEVIKSKFEALFGLPNCYGAINATHVIMALLAVETSDDWYDQENNYIMFLQGVVNHELRFFDIMTWRNDSVKTIEVFRIFQTLREWGPIKWKGYNLNWRRHD